MVICVSGVRAGVLRPRPPHTTLSQGGNSRTGDEICCRGHDFLPQSQGCHPRFFPGLCGSGRGG